VRATAAHPGWAATNLQSHSGSRLKHAGMTIGNRLWGSTPEVGALPILYAAVADVAGGALVGPGSFLEMRGGAPRLVGRSPAAQDADTARRLWAASAELTGVDFPTRLTG
jgi:hypothetical protein